ALDWARAQSLLDEMQAEGESLLVSSGVMSSQIQHRREVDMRYVGQGHEIRVRLPSGTLDEGSVSALHAAFEAEYLRLYGRLGPPVPVEIINWRVVSSGPKPSVRLQSTSAASGDADSALKGKRFAYFPELGGMHQTPVYDRYRLGVGASFDGPAIVEERESTLIVGPHARACVDEQYNLVVEF
ncbi:MAG: hydantoinase/oxoprolinase family protein, partial [Chloroflexi bacterium]|nr:hydantoinase/oxoprolinase family protein [Chloroflexota bacterium]